MKIHRHDFRIALALAVVIAISCFASFQAHAQGVGPPPACNAISEGRAHVIGYTLTPPVVAVNWWCPAATQYGGWQQARAALDLMAGLNATVIAKLNARDVSGLVSMRTVSVDAPQFAAVTQQMLPAILASRPPGPWVVAKNSSYPDRPVSRIVSGALVAVPGQRATVGSTCDCEKARAVNGSTVYCQTGAQPDVVAVCTKS